jgi:hypothetical protein
MDVRFKPCKQRLGRLLEAAQLIPPAAPSEFLFEIAPQALNEAAAISSSLS